MGDDIIRRLYPDVEAIIRECAEAQPGKPLVKEKQVRNRAGRIGASRPCIARMTPEEDALIHAHYPDRRACEEALPGREWREIMRRAWYLTRIGFSPSTPEEDDAIRRNYPDLDMIRRVCPTITEAKVERRARQLGIATSIGKHRRYSAAELRIVRRIYPDYPLLRALLPDRTHEALKVIARVLGLTQGKRRHAGGGHTTPWTEEEFAAIAVYGARLPGRSRAAIAAARRKRGIVLAPLSEEDKRLAGRRRAEVAARQSEEKRRQKAEAVAAKQAAKEERQRALATAAAARKAKMEEKRLVVATREDRAKTKPSRPVTASPVVPAPKPTPKVRRYSGLDVDPRVIGAAGRSRFGLGLVSTVQRTVPRDLWPSVKPRVIEDLVLAVVEGRCTPDGLPEIMPEVIQATMQRQFGGLARG